ncbi:MAG TPA: hypothetical protein VHE34_00690 [Puia sp.]|uniref:hypothetical protein n=1 Tax=Puia sp. TaxID=2045100 RepID=UPI002C5B0CDB|nr:hypothetical protein [Puia sp.]HVU93702.1 hypothetical protein [Puia sp.]
MKNGEDSLPVYKQVDGNLIRIPEDKRDPNRHYTRVTTPEGSYFVEFSEEEERQHISASEEWERRRPDREKDVQIREERRQRFRESLRYEYRYIAFLDILGWSDLLEKSAFDSEQTKKMGVFIDSVISHGSFIEQANQNSRIDNPFGDPQLTHFSDTLVLSTRGDRYGPNMLLYHLRDITDNLLRFGFFVRGGITCGLLIHRGSMIYGPGLVDAYNLERNHAVVPRILLSDDLAKVWQGGPPVQDISGRALGRTKDWRLDSDGRRFFDFLQGPILHMPDAIVNNEFEKGRLADIRERISAVLSDPSIQISVQKKYSWLARYFNDILTEYPTIELDHIPFSLA